MKKFLLIAAALLCLSFTGTASAANLSQTENATDARLGSAITNLTGASQPGGKATATATTSRRRKPRLMTIGKASSQAWQVAEYIYADPESSWDDFGVRTCTRLGRSRVSCYSFVSEDIYDEYGYYNDTILCDWFTVSYYTRTGKSKLWAGNTECVLLSEV